MGEKHLNKYSRNLLIKIEAQGMIAKARVQGDIYFDEREGEVNIVVNNTRGVRNLSSANAKLLSICNSETGEK